MFKHLVETVITNYVSGLLYALQYGGQDHPNKRGNLDACVEAKSIFQIYRCNLFHTIKSLKSEDDLCYCNRTH